MYPDLLYKANSNYGVFQESPNILPLFKESVPLVRLASANYIAIEFLVSLKRSSYGDALTMSAASVMNHPTPTCFGDLSGFAAYLRAVL